MSMAMRDEEIFEKQREEYRKLNREPHNLIFLDIDGVLNTIATRERSPFECIGIESGKAEILKTVVDANDAVVVLTSSWKREWRREVPREMDDDALYMVRTLGGAGVFLADKTEDHGDNRGNGIARYYHSHPHKGLVVFDDEQFHDYKACRITPFLVRTSFLAGGGLTDKHAARANKLFREQEDGTLKAVPVALTDQQEKYLVSHGFVHFGK